MTASVSSRVSPSEAEPHVKHVQSGCSELPLGARELVPREVCGAEDDAGWGKPEAGGNVFAAWGRGLVASLFTAKRRGRKLGSGSPLRGRRLWGESRSQQWRAACFLGQVFIWEKRALLLNLESWGLDPGGISDLGADLGRDSRWGGAHGCSRPSARGGPAAPAPSLRRLLSGSAPLTRLPFPALCKRTASFPGPPFCPPGAAALPVTCPPHHSLSTPSSPPTSQWSAGRITSTSVMSRHRPGLRHRPPSGTFCLRAL